MQILKLKYLFLFLLIGVFSCDDDDAFEVVLYEKGTAEATASTTNIEFGETVDFSSTSTKAVSAEWTFAGGDPSSSTAENVTVTYNSPGTFEAKLVVKYIDNQTETKTFTIVVNGPDTPIPFGGTAAVIPGTIEAENYNIGGQGVAYNDAEEANLAENAGSATYRDDDGVDVQVSGDGSLINIGYTNADEWTLYTVDAAAAGSYDFEFFVASDPGGFSLKLQSFNVDTGAITDLGETGDFNGTGGWGTYVGVTVPGVNLPAGTSHLRVLFTGGSTNLDKIVVTEAAGGGGGIPLGPKNIVFVTDDVAGDQGYIDLLVGAGHTVEAEAGKYNNLDQNAGLVATLNTFDLVIISRNTNSGNFSDPTVSTWATVTTPVLNMSSYVARSTRLQFFDSPNQIEGAGTSMKAILTDHPVFTNITLAGDNSFEVSTGQLHVVDALDPGNGTLIGTSGNDTYATIVEWDANTAAYAGGTVFPSKRMFLSGTGGGFTYNDAGSQLFLNCVEYIISGSVYVEPTPDPLNIAFVTDDVAGDQGYLDLLEGAGHTVEAEAGKYNNLNDNPGLVATLNAFDLVIISRNTNSGNFSDPTLPTWATVTTPVLNMSSYVARSTRLQFFDSPNQIEGAGTSMKAILTNHPVFNNITLAGDNSFEVSTGQLHVVDALDPGNGTLIGTSGNDTYATIVEWDANTAAYAGGTVFPSKRMFLSGTGGGFTYNEAGSQLFLNCVHYIVK